VAEARALQPDVVLMDVRMPVVDGVEATRQITADGFSANPDSPVHVLVLTSFHVGEAVYNALRAGASGFLLKHVAPVELAEAVRRVAAGDGWLDPAVTKALITEFASRPGQPLPSREQLASLTAREAEVLALLAHGLATEEILAHLVISEATLKTHVSRILMKLGVHDRAQAVAVAYRTGIVRP